MEVQTNNKPENKQAKNVITRGLLVISDVDVLRSSAP